MGWYIMSWFNAFWWCDLIPYTNYVHICENYNKVMIDQSTVFPKPNENLRSDTNPPINPYTNCCGAWTISYTSRQTPRSLYQALYHAKRRRCAKMPPSPSRYVVDDSKKIWNEKNNSWESRHHVAHFLGAIGLKPHLFNIILCILRRVSVKATSIST